MDGTIPPKTSARSAQLRRRVSGPSRASKILPLQRVWVRARLPELAGSEERITGWA